MPHHAGLAKTKKPLFFYLNYLVLVLLRQCLIISQVGWLELTVQIQDGLKLAILPDCLSFLNVWVSDGCYRTSLVPSFLSTQI